MASPIVDRLRERWEQMQERERRLVVILGATLAVCIFLWIGFSIRDGLGEIEAKNDETREALLSLTRFREAGGGSPAASSAVQIPEEAVKLSRYLETIIKDLGLKSPTYPQEKETTKGDYTEASFTIQMGEMTVFELKDLLEKIETNNRAVVVRELKIKRKVRDQEKLDVTLSVSAFRKASSKEKKSSKDEASEESEPSEKDKETN